jgi:hypothetical protein
MIWPGDLAGGGGARRFGRGMNGRGDLGERRSTPRKQLREAVVGTRALSWNLAHKRRSDGERGTLPIPSERNVRDLGDAILQNLMASLLEDHFREY